MSKNVLFRVAVASPAMASTRYRAMMPAVGLEALGYRCDVNAQPLSDGAIRASACVVFAKAFRASDVATAARVRASGVPYVLDVCDHMFFAEYGGGKGPAYAQAFKTMAAGAAAITTTGEALALVVRGLAPKTPIRIIPDQLETPETLARVQARAESWARPSLGARLRRILRGPPPPPVPRAPTAPSAATTLIWFGNHGAGHSAFGMGALETHLPLLAEINAETPLRLLVVSNSREKFERLFADAPFIAEYRDWASARIFDDLAEAKICLMPMPHEPFTQTKSANRAVLALSRGVAVVADDFPALTPLRECLITNDWAGGVRRYLADETLRQAHVARGREIVEQLYSAETVAKQWADLVEGLSKTAKDR